MSCDRQQGAIALLATAATVWATLTVAAPVVSAARPPASRGWGTVVATVSYLGGGVVCHQIPARSFHASGAQLPVCARCAGLYWSAPFGFAWALVASFRPSRRSPRGRAGFASGRRRWVPWLLGASALPTAGTWSGEMIGIVHPSNVERAVAALPLGFAIAATVGLALVGSTTRETSR